MQHAILYKQHAPHATLYKQPLNRFLAEPLARHRMEASFEAAQLPAALGGAGSSGAAAGLPQARGDSDAVHAASTAHDETLRHSNTMARMRSDSSQNAALALLELQRR